MLPHIPWGMLVMAMLIAAVGIWNLASASRPPHLPVWQRQSVNLAVGLFVCLALSILDYRFVQRMAWPLYALNLGALLALRVIGHRAKGAESWFALGPFRIEPAEFTKLVVVIMLAKFFNDDYQPMQKPYGVLQLIKPLVIIAIPSLLVLVQPDLGTFMMIALTVVTILAFARVKTWLWATAGVGILLFSIVIWNDYAREQPEPRFTLVRHILKKHQSQRISGWLEPEADLKGSGYHAAQSKIAVGSGGLWGKGWKKGTQTELFFLPEQHTDFIFSVFAEEQGFFRCLLLLAMYGVLLLASLGVAVQARDRFGSFVAVGVAAMIFWQVFENIGMVIGLLPVTGITLPLLSYGGSSMVSVMMGLGLLVSISMRRHMF
jgi:rod shape determining protein RodA